MDVSKRKFVPQLVEHSQRHSKNTDRQEQDPTKPQMPSGDIALQLPTPKRRFAPVPVEITTRSNHARKHVEPADDHEAPLLPHERINSGPDVKSSAKPQIRRKFAPQLIDTAARSRKAGDTAPAVLLSDKTNALPEDASKKVTDRPALVPHAPTNTPVSSSLYVPTMLKPQPNRQGSMHPHYTTRANTRANTRTHSFKVPDLEAIESSESGSEAPPSLSRSQSIDSVTSGLSDAALNDPTRMRESADDKFSGYLLALAARAAEKQLREQAAAAFPNQDYHEPVSHYMNRVDSSEEEHSPRRAATRLDSADEAKIALREMQRHGEQRSKKQQAQQRPSTQRKKTAAFNVEFDKEASQDAWATPSAPKNLIGGRQKDPDLKQMRKAASPPMLGGDIDFPRCPSPENARFDVTQGCEFLRKNMCYLSEQSVNCQTGLWGTPKGSEKPSLASLPSVKLERSKSPGGGGLWGGFCTDSDTKATHQPAGIVTPMRTPAVEREDPFSFSTPLSHSNLAGVNAAKRQTPQQLTATTFPPSPPSSQSNLSTSADEATAQFELEARLDTEFSDAFVTQVYNYLSLGYPALARKFDPELSRISRVPIEELQLDDKFPDARGYIHLEDDHCSADPDEDKCARWRALRVYVREWGRQNCGREIGFVGQAESQLAWGMPVRKGSWGL